MQGELTSLVLAAGRGVRMRSEHLNKVCFPIGELPVISRALRTYEECGISSHLVVIGHLGEQVREVVNRHHDNVQFAYQTELKGTGHATRCGAKLLQRHNYQGAVLVVAGDKVVRAEPVRALISTMRDTDADLVFLTGDKSHNPPGTGRVLKDDSGRPVAIVEVSEIALSHLLAEVGRLISHRSAKVATRELLEAMRRHFPQESKLKRACPELLALIAARTQIDTDKVARVLYKQQAKTQIPILRDGRKETINAGQVEELTDEVNQSVYLFKAPALYEALEHIESANAQGEQYLTDTIAYLSSACDSQGQVRFRVSTVRVEDPSTCMGFNTPGELQEICEMYA
jgi:bifunctional N-acetylglucosamine-1-phosphate-uridyltransferase/glucosamine-1-phosphate-acetyltransferase GlmU-like protein